MQLVSGREMCLVWYFVAILYAVLVVFVYLFAVLVGGRGGSLMWKLSGLASKIRG